MWGDSMDKDGDNRKAISSDTTSLDVTYCTKEQLQSSLSKSHQKVLGVVGFSDQPLPHPVAPAPFIQVPLTPVEEDALFELWTTDEPVNYTQFGPLHCASSPTLLFGCLSIELAHGKDLSLSTEQAYKLLFAHIDQSGYGHLLRIWHYFPHITDGDGILERYKAFNSGRHRAFSAYRKDMSGAPAASALGTSSGGSLVIYFISSSSPGLPLENQRQVSAYNYPKEYGQFSPIFSRAMQGGGLLFISGTASIVGHASMYDGLLLEQTHETITNLQAVLATARDALMPAGVLQLKAYLRYPEHLQLVRKALSDAFGRETPVAFLQAQICRRELLLEIEGTYKAQGKPVSD